jgi:hypothetical protein
MRAAIERVASIAMIALGTLPAHSPVREADLLRARKLGAEDAEAFR